MTGAAARKKRAPRRETYIMKRGKGGANRNSNRKEASALLHTHRKLQERGAAFDADYDRMGAEEAEDEEPSTANSKSSKSSKKKAGGGRSGRRGRSSPEQKQGGVGGGGGGGGSSSSSSSSSTSDKNRKSAALEQKSVVNPVEEAKQRMANMKAVSKIFETGIKSTTRRRDSSANAVEDALRQPLWTGADVRRLSNARSGAEEARVLYQKMLAERRESAGSDGDGTGDGEDSSKPNREPTLDEHIASAVGSSDPILLSKKLGDQLTHQLIQEGEAVARLDASIAVARKALRDAELMMIDQGGQHGQMARIYHRLGLRVKNLEEKGKVIKQRTSTMLSKNRKLQHQTNVNREDRLDLEKSNALAMAEINGIKAKIREKKKDTAEVLLQCDGQENKLVAIQTKLRQEGKRFRFLLAQLDEEIEATGDRIQRTVEIPLKSLGGGPDGDGGNEPDSGGANPNGGDAGDDGAVGPGGSPRRRMSAIIMRRHSRIWGALLEGKAEQAKDTRPLSEQMGITDASLAAVLEQTGFETAEDFVRELQMQDAQKFSVYNYLNSLTEENVELENKIAALQVRAERDKNERMQRSLESQSGKAKDAKAKLKDVEADVARADAARNSMVKKVNKICEQVAVTYARLGCAALMNSEAKRALGIYNDDGITPENASRLVGPRRLL